MSIGVAWVTHAIPLLIEWVCRYNWGTITNQGDAWTRQ
jgi:hypothetical protein